MIITPFRRKASFIIDISLNKGFYYALARISHKLSLPQVQGAGHEAEALMLCIILVSCS